jgi:hypothetical protein
MVFPAKNIEQKQQIKISKLSMNNFLANKWQFQELP